MKDEDDKTYEVTEWFQIKILLNALIKYGSKKTPNILKDILAKIDNCLIC